MKKNAMAHSHQEGPSGKSTLAPSSGYKAPHSPPLISSQGGIREGQAGRQDIHHHWAVTRPFLQSAMPRLSPPHDHDEVALLLPTGVVLKEARWRIRAFIMANRMPPLPPQHGGGHMGRSRETSYSFQQRGISEAFWGIRTPTPTQKWGDLYHVSTEAKWKTWTSAHPGGNKTVSPSLSQPQQCQRKPDITESWNKLQSVISQYSECSSFHQKIFITTSARKISNWMKKRELTCEITEISELS